MIPASVAREYVLFGLVGIYILETILSVRWSFLFFRTGILIFRFSVLCEPGSNVPPPALIQARARSKYLPSVLVGRLTSTTYGIRERMLEFKLLVYTPVMHGLLEFDPPAGTVTVTGRANWFDIAFLLWFVEFSFEFREPLFIFILVAVFSLIYLAQCRQYRKVAHVASEEWCRVPHNHQSKG